MMSPGRRSGGSCPTIPASAGFLADFVRHGTQALRNKAWQRIPFDSLLAAEQDELVRMLDGGRGQPFASNVDQHPEYICSGWTKGQLAQTWALPAYNPPAKRDPIPYYDFYIGPRNTGPGGSAEDSDARIAADKITPPADLSRHEPVIIIGRPGVYILLEGYLRSVLFMRDANPVQRLLVWLPKSL